jgi:hypothetical protein
LQSARLVLRAKSVTKIAATWRMFTEVKRYAQIKIRVTDCQKLTRGFLARCLARRLREAKRARKLQAVMRMLVLRRLFIQKKKAVVVIQKRHRGNLGRARARDYVRVSAAENIQRVARGRHDQRMWKDLSDTVIVAQGMWRQKLAKRHVARMKAEEKDARVQMQKAAQAAQQAKEAAAAAEAAKLKVAQQEAERKQAEEQAKELAEKHARDSIEMERLREQIKELETRPPPSADPTISEEKLAHFQKIELELEEEKQKNAKLSADLEAKTLELDETKARYMQLLKTTSQTSAAVHGSPSPSNALGPDGVSPRRSLDAQKSIKVKRSIDVQLVGATNVGKTSLLADFVTKESPEMLERLNEQRSTLLAHHQLTLDGAPLKILDCSGNPRASHLVKGWFASAQWVICVYDVCEPETLTVALDLMETALTAQARVLLFGNKYRCDHGEQFKVSVDDLAKAKDAAVRQGALAMEASNISDCVNMILSMGEDKLDFKPPPRAEGSDGGQKGGLMSGLMSMFGANKGTFFKNFNFVVSKLKTQESSSW